jgi:DNA-binding protein HU-beta
MSADGAKRACSRIVDACSTKSGLPLDLPENQAIPRNFPLTAVVFGRCFALTVAPAAADCRPRERSRRSCGGPFFPTTRTVKMSKKDLIDAVAEATELSKDKAGVAVEAVIKHIEKTMKDGQEVRIPGFGTFKVANRKARKARNPQTGVEMMLKASRVPKFQASKNLKDLLN